MNINTQPVALLRSFWLIGFSLLFILTSAALPSYAARKMPREYQLKAVFLDGFTKFIVWPKSAFAKRKTRLRICVLGEHPFGRALNIAVARTNKRKRKGRHLEVRYFNVVEQSRGCHVLFVSKSERYRRAAILDHLEGKPILTVSDMEGFVINGGMIQFYTRRHKVRFDRSPIDT